MELNHDPARNNGKGWMCMNGLQNEYKFLHFPWCILREGHLLRREVINFNGFALLKGGFVCLAISEIVNGNHMRNHKLECTFVSFSKLTLNHLHLIGFISCDSLWGESPVAPTPTFEVIFGKLRTSTRCQAFMCFTTWISTFQVLCRCCS